LNDYAVIQLFSPIPTCRNYWFYAPLISQRLSRVFALQGLWAIPYLFGSTGETFDSAAFQM
jgi:hypothetical protein